MQSMDLDRTHCGCLLVYVRCRWISTHVDVYVKCFLIAFDTESFVEEHLQLMPRTVQDSRDNLFGTVILYVVSGIPA